MNELLKRQIDLLPSHPGVYLMKDKDDHIIYVGKAKNLKKRVSQYFLRPQSGKVAAMVSRVDHFETIGVGTEKEAFILEMNLIKEHLPRYNILMMDDSHYPYIALRKSDAYLKISRDSRDRRYIYFGPYPSSRGAYDVIDLVNSLFPTRKCRTLGTKPCLYYHMGNCLAPCLKKVDEAEYKALYEKIKSFLGGDTSKIEAELRDKMADSSAALDYERAAEYKKLLDGIKATMQAQGMENRSREDYDVVAYSHRDGYFSLSILPVRKGKVLGKECLVYPSYNDADAEELAERLAEYYLSHKAPGKIYGAIEGLKESLEPLLEESEVIVPKEGVKLDQVGIAALNAKEGLDRHFSSARLHDDSLELLEELGKMLGIKTPYRIELFDNSHLQGSEAVAAEVAFVNGEPSKKLYRKFLLSTENAGDDYASMREAVSRRYSRLKEEGADYPDLILADGGLGQVHATLEGLEKAEVEIPVYGLYKNDRHETEGLIDRDGHKFPMEKTSPLFFMLMRMQDEVHRYAISFHRSRREKAMKKDIFADIRGLGPKRQEALRRHYASLSELLSASVTELGQFMPEDSAKALYEKLHG